jgi:diaminopimelate decarboxylase
VPYKPQDKAPEIRSFMAQVRKKTEGKDLFLMVEPGRSIVGEAGVLLTRVLYRKQTPSREFVIVDAAMNDLIRPALYEAYHAIVPVELPPPEVALEVVDIVGPICECGDFLARERPIPWPERGALLAVLGAGAYGMAMASSYNTRPLAPEVLVAGDRWSVVRARRTVEAMLGDECYPEWLQG